MNLRRSHIARTVGLAVLWAGLVFGDGTGTATESGGEPPYPVWWSPVLELDSLDDIDERLARALWRETDEGMPLIKIDGDKREDVTASSCVELIRFDEQGYFGAGSHDQWVQQYLLAQCRAIEWLRRARPAERSFLREFVLDEEAIHLLPAMVDISPSCDFLCRQNVANERRIPLGKFEPVFRVTVTSNEEIEIRTLGAETDLSILARGDFNEDGLDDLLLLASTGATEGTWAGAEIYLVSREAPGAVLAVLETGTTVCTDYHCQKTYDYPNVLGETNPSPTTGPKSPEPRGPITSGAIGQLPGQADIMAPEHGPPYPVWWWPSIYLQSLEDVDELYEMEFWLATEGTPLEKVSGGQLIEINARSCKEFVRYVREGYRLHRQNLSHETIITRCQALERLKTAKPAKVSYLRNLVLDETVLDLLPAPLGFWTSPCVAYEALAFNEAGKSWQRFTEERAEKRQVPAFADGRVYHLQFINERMFRAWALAWVIDIEILAGGDFNGDGLDDILVKRDLSTDVSGHEDSDLLILSRDAPDAVLRFVNVEDFPDSELHRMAIGAETTAVMPTANQCRVGSGDQGGNEGGEADSVWWSDQLELQSLDSISERLQRRFSRPSSGAFQLDTWPRREEGPVSAENCEELLSYLDADYSIETDYELGHWQAMRCRALVALRGAKPARRSYLRDFVLDQGSIELFPILFAETSLLYGPCRLHLYNQARFSLAAYIGDEVADGRNVFHSSDPTFRIESRGDKEITLATRYRGARLSIVGGGDIDGDGLDDILLEMSRWRYDWEELDDNGSPRTYGVVDSLFVLSRDDPAGVFWVVNADEFLPSKQDCDDWRAETEWSIRQE